MTSLSTIIEILSNLTVSSSSFTVKILSQIENLIKPKSKISFFNSFKLKKSLPNGAFIINFLLSSNFEI